MIDSCSVDVDAIGGHLAESETLNPGQTSLCCRFQPLAARFGIIYGYCKDKLWLR